MPDTMRRRALLVLFEGLACLATVFCALFAALGLTLWRAHYLVSCMDRTGYPAQIVQGLRVSCVTYAQEYDLTLSSLTGSWNEALVRRELIRSVDETYHQVRPARPTPFDSIVENPDIGQVGRELVALWSAAVGTPFSNLLNILLQYSRASAVPITLFLGVGAGSLAMLFRASRDRRQLGGCAAEVGRAVTLCAPVLPGALALVCARLDWLPEQSPAAALFSAWSTGFFVCWALCLLAAAACWAALGFALRRPAAPSLRFRHGRLEQNGGMGLC